MVRPRILSFWKLGTLRPLGKVTKQHQGQLVVKNILKVDNGLRASRPNPKRAGNGLNGLSEIQALCMVWEPKGAVATASWSTIDGTTCIWGYAAAWSTIDGTAAMRVCCRYCDRSNCTFNSCRAPSYYPQKVLAVRQSGTTLIDLYVAGQEESAHVHVSVYRAWYTGTFQLWNTCYMQWSSLREKLWQNTCGI